MTDCLASEVLFFLYSVLTGSFFAFIYDHFRLLRRLIRHARFVVHLEDLIFWIICFFVSFFYSIMETTVCSDSVPALGLQLV